MKIIIEGDKRFLNDFIKQAKNKSGVLVEIVEETIEKEEKTPVKTKEEKTKLKTK